MTNVEVMTDIAKINSSGTFEILSEAKQSVIHGPVVYYNGEPFYKFTTFSYAGRNYRIDIDTQQLVQEKTKMLRVWNPDTREAERVETVRYKFVQKQVKEYRTNYMLPCVDLNKKNELQSSDRASTRIASSAPLLNYLLLKPDALETFLAHPELCINHMAACSLEKDDYSKLCYLYGKYLDVKRKYDDGNYADTRAILDVFYTSMDPEYIMLRKATRDYRNRPELIRYDDVSNLELCTPSDNSTHYSVLCRLITKVPDIFQHKVSCNWTRLYADKKITEADFINLVCNSAIVEL